MQQPITEKGTISKALTQLFQPAVGTAKILIKNFFAPDLLLYIFKNLWHLFKQQDLCYRSCIQPMLIESITDILKLLQAFTFRQLPQLLQLL